MTKTLLTLVASAAFLTAAEPPTIAKLLNGSIANAEHDVVSLAEAMPADKYDFAPTDGAFKGVRTFKQQVKHVAAVAYMVSAAAREEKPTVDLGGENGPDSIQTKEQCVQFLKDAFAYAHKAALGLTAENALGMVKSPFGDGQMARAGAIDVVAWHSFDHYGQMVVYARMNNVVPPASR